MKLTLAICAKELPEVGDYYAKATFGDGDEIGKTTVIPASTNPSWTSVLACEDPGGKTLTVSICGADDAVVSTMSVSMEQLMEQSTVAVDADGTSGSTVLAVHVEEYVLEPGTLQLLLEGHKLKNMERGLGLFSKSDPFFVLSGGSEDSLYQSEVVSNDLSPTWTLANIDLAPLYDAGLDVTSPLTLVVYDQDLGDKKDLIGTVSTSINELLEAHDMPLADDKGLVRVKRAQLVGHGGGTTITASATQALENAANVLLAKQNIEKSREVAAKCQERAAALEAESVDKQSAAAKAAEETAAAKAAAAELKEQANEAEEASTTKACSGTLQLTLKGADLPDTDGIFNKSDPFYQIYGADGTSMYQSEVVADCLDPSFKMAALDICALTEGRMDGPVRITLHEKDKGDSNEYLGQIVTSVKELLETASSTAMDLKKGGGSAQGHMFVAKAELLDYKDWKEEATKLKAAATKANMAAFAQAKTEQLAVDEAKKAQDNATKAKEAADAAQKAVEEMEASM